MAADVHKFLAGDGTLPNHGDGFTAETVTTATQPDGTPLFPDIRKADEAGTWPPTAAEVVTWCQAAFAVDAGQPTAADDAAGWPRASGSSRSPSRPTTLGGPASRSTPAPTS